MAGRNTAL